MPGTLCVRTVLSILPTLSREYDHHFKAFEGISYVCPTSSVDKGEREDNSFSIRNLPVIIRGSFIHERKRYFIHELCVDFSYALKCGEAMIWNKLNVA